MRVPRFFLKNRCAKAESIVIKGKQDEEFSLYLLTPKELLEEKNLPALIFVHGGGFVFEASSSHYKLALAYALKCRCKVIYVKYNLAPKYPFPFPQEEGYKALEYAYTHATDLGIDPNKIALTGDSAGATICVSAILQAQEEGKDWKPLFQLLIYPWLDKRGDSESNRKYTDTPMWNSSRSKNSHSYTNPENKEFPPYINSPVEYGDLTKMPPAYIEVAEFDCLHDDGVLYHSLLKEAGVESILHETKGTMHGYDTKFKAPTTQKMVKQRIEFIRAMFENACTPPLNQNK
ncbi:MAG: alpha/beta hydrolase [Bacilli bacterium]|nr:alpha/beta hydrolase [Bacilli bacterium]